MRQSCQGRSIQWVAFWAVGLVAGYAWGQGAYGGGTGTADDPYLIQTATQLNRIGGNLSDLDKHFRVVQDIDLSDIPSFNIIGSLQWPFKGVFDGDGHTISNVTISASENGVGFFGTVEGREAQLAIIRNVHLDGVSIDAETGDVGGLVGVLGRDASILNCSVAGSVNGNSRVGGLVGWCDTNNTGRIEGCHSTASVSSTGDSIGGLIGRSGWPGSGSGIQVITKCYATGTVKGRGLGAGGFIGYYHSGEISQCYALGDVFGGNDTGGFIGHAGFCTISNCYARGRVDGNMLVGGFVGSTDSGVRDMVNCYSTGLVTYNDAWEQHAGGFSGGQGGDVTECFWDVQTSGMDRSHHGHGKTTAEMQTESTFTNAGWDFVGETANGTDDIWTIQEGVTYPYFTWQPDPNDTGEPDPADLVVSVVGDTNLELFLEDAFEITLMLRNIGETDAVPNSQGHFDTILYLSGDRNPDWNQLDAATYGVGQVQLDQLQAGDEHLVSVPLMAPSQPGIWYLRAKIDDSDEVMEGDEQNNWTTIVLLTVKRLLKADITGDGLVDLEDLLVLSEYWLTDNDVADIYPYPEGDGIVDLGDFSALASEWNLTDGVSSDRVPLSTGTFEMGDHFNEGYSREVPVHAVTVSPFHVSRHLITNTQYCDFLNSALSKGSIAVIDGVVHSVDSWMNYPYCDTSSACSNSQIAFDGSEFSVRTKGGRDMSDDPVVQVSWYGAAAYCNWRSEQAGRQACYNPYTWRCDFSKNGYHLPTEAQWEYAARGGLIGRRFPWGDTISELDANYYSDTACSYDVSSVCGFNPLFRDWVLPYTSPVRGFPPNGYGLYDMAGNVREWCHDWYAAYGSAPKTDPRGPQTGTHRIIRGGCWGSPAVFCRVAYRGGYLPDSRYFILGFRVAVED